VFDRFTERARSAIATARKEAERMGSEVIAPEHLVLGLAADPASAAGRALARAGGRDGLRAEWDATATPRAADPSLGQLAFTREVRAALERAAELGVSVNAVDAQHILVALLEAEGPVTETLVRRGIRLDEVRASLPATPYVTPPAPPPPSADATIASFRSAAVLAAGTKAYRFAEDTNKAVALACEEAARLSAPSLTATVLLAGVLRVSSGLALVLGRGVDAAKLLEETIALAQREVATKRPGPLSPEAKRALELAGEESTAARAKTVSVQHLLQGIARAAEGETAQLLARNGLTDGKRGGFFSRLLRGLGF
jgi:ATP-dependent Clp protease ATP-binding subunit ClpA